MSIESFSVQNVKCGGCAANIEQGISAMDGVTSVSVDIAGGAVEVNGDTLDRKRLAAKLAELGYPEK